MRIVGWFFLIVIMMGISGVLLQNIRINMQTSLLNKINNNTDDLQSINTEEAPFIFYPLHEFEIGNAGAFFLNNGVPFEKTQQAAFRIGNQMGLYWFVFQALILTGIWAIAKFTMPSLSKTEKARKNFLWWLISVMIGLLTGFLINVLSGIFVTMIFNIWLYEKHLVEKEKAPNKS